MAEIETSLAPPPMAATATRLATAPMRRLVVAISLVLAVIVGAIGLAVSQPWLGLAMAYDKTAGGMVVRAAEGPAADVPIGTVLVAVRAGGDRLTFEPLDLTGQVDGSFGPFADFQRFMARQGRFAEMQRQDALVFTDHEGRDWTVRPEAHRPIGTLGSTFWIGIVVGAVSGLVPAAIFVFRPGDAAARYLLLSGFGMLICAPVGPIYTTRELAIPETVFYLINGANFLGGTLFAAALFSLLLYYPRPLAPRWVGVAVVVAFLAWYVVQALGGFPDLTFARRFHVMCAMVGAFVLSGVHWRLTRRDPIARAALSWFLLSWVVVVSAFCCLILAPQMFDVDTSEAEPFGFLLFILVYAGLAVGIMRYRLFELGEWWARIMAWTLGLMLLVGLDLVFLVGLRLSVEASLSLALLICGLVWLPARGWITARVLQRNRPDDRALFEGVVQIGLTASAEQQVARWVEILKARFDPLDIVPAPASQTARLELDGLALVTPAVEGLPSLRLSYAQGGRALFSPSDLTQARALADMLRFVVESRQAYERGVIVERKRIAGDIHDNLGATLLSALHSPDGARKDRFIRETLADLRSIVTEPTGGEAGLAEVLAGSRKEMAERLEARGVALAWPVDATPAVELDSKVAQSLRAMLREITNNILKHAQASTVTVELSAGDGVLCVAVEDDGLGFAREAVVAGAGLGGLEDRAARHGGALRWSAGANGRGARVEIRLPTLA